MNEKEKMLLGNLYNPNDLELKNYRKKAKELCSKYNSSTIQQSEKNLIIKKLFKKIGDNFLIEPSFYCDYGFNIEAGDNFYINHNCVILDCAKVTFGNNVFIGPNCGFYTAYHPLDFNTRNSGLEFAAPITIGNNVWIGGNVCILSNVSIGDNSVIGAGSVVTKNIPSNVIAFGNPCKVIKNI